MQYTAFFVKHRYMTSRPVTPEDITMSSVSEMKNLKTISDNWTAPVDDKPSLSPLKVYDFFEDFSEYLNKHQGTVSKRPLGYVVRKAAAVLPHETDPAVGIAGTVYGTHTYEIEARAPIYVPDSDGNITTKYDPDFIQDNKEVWNLLWSIIKPTTYASHIKKHQKDQDGRSAYLSLYDSLLGSQSIDNHISKAENRLQNLTYDGKPKKNWNFEKYVCAHKEQHVILDKLTKHGYKGLDEQSKVRHFKKGISDPALQFVKSSLSAHGETKPFDDIVAVYRTFIESTKAEKTGTQMTLNVSAVSETGNRISDTSTSNKKATAKSDGYNPSDDYSKFKLPIRYYSSKEWNNLSKGQRNFLRSNRKSAKNAKPQSLKSSLAELTRQVASITKTLADDSVQTESTDHSDDTGELPIDTPPKKKMKFLPGLTRS